MSWTVKELASYRVYLNPRSALPGAALADLRPATGGAYWLWFTPASPLPPNVMGTTTGTRDRVTIAFRRARGLLETIPTEPAIALTVQTVASGARRADRPTGANPTPTSHRIGSGGPPGSPVRPPQGAASSRSI